MAKRRANHEGSIHLRSCVGRWMGAVRMGRGPHGKGIRRYVSAKTRIEVAGKLKFLQRQIDDPLPRDGHVTLSVLFERWSQDVMRHQVEETTLRNYLSAVLLWSVEATPRYSTKIVEPGCNRRSAGIRHITSAQTREDLAGDHEMLLIELADISNLPSPVLFVDARIEVDYRAGHIPGAIHQDSFDFANDLTDGDNLHKVIDGWHRMFCEVGIPDSGSVVFYDVGTENRASRPAFMLHYLGHKNSYVLRGGMTAWLDNGGDITVEPTILPVTSWDVLPLNQREDIVLGVDSVIPRLGDDRVVLLDVRDEPEFLGVRQMEGNPRLGRIPGAKGFEWTRFLTRRSEYPPEAGTSRNDGYILEHLRPSEEVRAELAELGIKDLDSEVIIYCQKSHRASLAYVAMKEMGYTNARVYVGSFREWSKRLELPIES